MGASFIWDYVRSCTAHPSGPADCGPVVQFGVIAALLFLAVAAFLFLVATRLREESRLAIH